ncbi:hypothetical protein DL95DRAFT_430064 [Leptodontidium sp. 2 PMI_412]|nr:hypothetical protein DL95DRAFT_430064 [Leptodontidium sp. 2 PMI_412]
MLCSAGAAIDLILGKFLITRRLHSSASPFPDVVSPEGPVSAPAEDGSAMERKPSSLMAPIFMVSALGKVIVFAISLRSYLLVTTLSKSQRTIKLNFRDIGLNHTWKIDALPFYYSLVNSLDPELLDAIIPHAEAVSKNLPEKQRKIHVRSATAFLYLFLSLGSPDRPHPDQPAGEAEVQIERINRWAFVGELCIYGDPVENSSGPSSVTPLITFPKLPLLLVDIQQPRSTATQVENVRALKHNFPVMTDIILDRISQLTTSVLEQISSADFVGDGISDAPEPLGTLIRINHGFLVSLGVSHPRLERIRELVDYANIGWTKLTGAGGGGYCPGCRRSWGALACRIPKSTDGEGGEEIDQEKFGNAVGVQGIEQLVGVEVQENRENRKGWKFWTRAVAV